MPGPFDGAEVLVYVNMAEPVSATLDIGTGSSGVHYEADEAGVVGNNIRIRHVAGSGNNVPTSVAVSGNDITVTLGTGGTGSVNATAQNVVDAVNAHPRAKQLVTASNLGDGTGTATTNASLTALTGGAAAGTADFQPVARQQGIELEDSMDSIDANSKGDRFSLTLPGRQSGSFTLPGLISFEDGTQARLRRAYQNREEILVQIILPASVTGEAADSVEEARCRLTGYTRSYPDSDVATFSAPVALQENWRQVV